MATRAVPGGSHVGFARRSSRWAVPMAPAMLLLSVFVLAPIGYAVYLSLTNTRLTGKEARFPKFIGFDNFAKLFHSDALPRSVWLTLLFVIGSALIGQQFTEPKYFWGRLSGAGTYPYNASASGGTNFGPLNPALAAPTAAGLT